ncbi:MAG: CapA family protein [Deltaproteobacteria bacterium]|jgi:poly-gamma-glutamate synthesis protein (capsule biosynthesis protein)|nr:CapA family protein [Deltaproteobacteria bacterium]MBW2531171.1 CapA family protein [Deltaproteobacteria bacterium]
MVEREGRAVRVRLTVGALAGVLGALAAVLLAFGAMASRSVEVYTAGELTGEYVDPPPGVHTLVLVGDIMPWDRASEYLRRHGAEYPYRATAPLLRTADLAVGNLEGPVSASAELRQKRDAYRVPPWTLQGLSWAGFDLVSLANNHVLDCGPEGLLETFRHLDAAGIGYFGAGSTRAAALEPKIVRVGPQRVALCGVVAGEKRLADGGTPAEALGREQVRGVARAYQEGEASSGTAVATDRSLDEMVRRAREGADVVVVFAHSGIRYHREPTPLQRQLAQAAIDAGADLVVGQHAQFWQPVELYRGKPILYGLGNFAFGSANRRADEGLLARVQLDAAGLDVVELFPLFINNRDETVQYESKVMRGRSAERALRRLTALSSAPLDVERGRAVLRLRR